MSLARYITGVACVLCLLPLSAAPRAQNATYCGTQAWRAFIEEASRRTTLPVSWLDAAIRTESAGCASIDGRPTISKAGAMGLMQLMPAVWEEYRQRLQLGIDPYDPRDNILAGAVYLRELRERYGTSGMWIAYHAGPARYERWLTEGAALPTATLDYIARVQDLIGSPIVPDRLASTTGVTPFVRSSGNVRGANGLSAARRNASLFVTLKHPKLDADESGQDSSDVQRP